MDIENMTPAQVLKQLGIRLRHTLNRGRKNQKLTDQKATEAQIKKLTDLEVKGMLIGRIASILAFMKLNPMQPIPSTVSSAFWEAVKFLMMYEPWKDKKIVDLSDFSIRSASIRIPKSMQRNDVSESTSVDRTSVSGLSYRTSVDANAGILPSRLESQ